MPLRLRQLLCCLFLLCAGLCAVPAAAGSQVLADDFTGSSATLAWQVFGSACLTAGHGGGTIPACASGVPGGYAGNTPDASGSGALLLTQATGYDSGGIVSLNSFPGSAGFSVTFRAVSYGGTGADGIAFFLLDASQGVPSRLGTNGGSLGYVNIPGGFLGIGLDEFGNFSAPGCGGGGCSGGPGVYPNAVVLRGPTSGLNPYLDSALPPFALWSNVATRRAATVHTYTIAMTSAGLLSVAIDGTTYVSNVDVAARVGKIPAYLRVGIAASTGGSTNIHQILSFSVSSLSLSNLVVSKLSEVVADPVNGTTRPKAIPGATVRYCVIVSNLPGNPPASAVTISDPIGSAPITVQPGTIRINGTATNGICAADGSPGGSYSGATVSATLGSIAGGASATVYFDATVN